MTLHFEKPSRAVDPITNESYFCFEQSSADKEYTVVWDPENELQVPDDILTSVLEYFLQCTSSYFAKAPTVEQMKKRTVHPIRDLTTVTQNYIYPNDRLYTMRLASIKIYSKKTEFVWVCCKSEAKPIDEQIPSDFLAAYRPSSPTAQQQGLTAAVAEADTKKIVITSDPSLNAIMEAVADIPLEDVGSPWSEGPGGKAFRLDDDSEERMYRLRVLEAKLSAKLASYKAKKEADKYYSKFGRPPPDYGVSDYENDDNSDDYGGED